MLQPARVKHTKVHKGRLREKASRGTKLSFGSFGLKAEQSSWLKSNQLEAAKPRTAKSSEVGMGGGRGALSHFVVPVEAGRIIFEIDGLTEQQAEEALRMGAFKLPIKTRIIKR